MQRISAKAWQQDEIDQIAVLLREGQSASRIAARINAAGRETTRNAIIGIVARNKTLAAIGFCAKKPPGSTKTREVKLAVITDGLRPLAHRGFRNHSATKQPAPPSTEIVVFQVSAEEYDRNILALSLVDLTEKTCKWPVGEAARMEPHAFCSHQSDEGSPYCSHHRKRGTEISKPRIRA
jgi:GcrA cell cycle regulator